jgi:hypothetical protein
MSSLIPLDENAVVPAIDGVRNGVGFHAGGYWLLAIGEKQETPRLTGGFPTIGAANSQ